MTKGKGTEDAARLRNPRQTPVRHRPIASPDSNGLVPSIHRLQHGGMSGGWVYIMTNRPYGTLYLGVTGNIARRAWEHREGVSEGFTKRYGLKRLVFAERHDDIRSAIQREKTVKHWPRAWKINLILRQNPDWDDLYETLL